MNENYKKYALIAIVVLMIVVIVSVVYSKRDKNITYTNVNPQSLELTDKEISGEANKVVIKDTGYISQLYCDGAYIYYLCVPISYGMEQGLSYEEAYIKKVDVISKKTEVVHEFIEIGKFAITKIVYSDDYLFLSMSSFENENTKESILKMSKETGDIDVVYEKVIVDARDYGINISNNYNNEYVIWSELYEDYTLNEYKVYDIEKGEISAYKYEDRADKNYYGNPSISNDTLMYGAVEESKNILICKEIATDEEAKMELGEEKFASGFIYNDWLVWEDSYNSENNHVYLFDFNSKEKFLIDTDIAHLKLCGNYVVTVNHEQVSFIDYVNNEKFNYKLEEGQTFVNVIDGYIVLEQNCNGGVEVVFVNVY